MDLLGRDPRSRSIPPTSRSARPLRRATLIQRRRGSSDYRLIVHCGASSPKQ
jgi:hypothetical protein